MFVGEKIRLDPIQRAHLPKIISWMYKEDIIARAFFGDPLPRSLEEMEAWLQQLRTNPNARVLAVIHRETEEIVGEVALQPIDWRNRSAFFAIILGEESRRGEGVGTEAARLALRYAFEGLNLHRVEANVLSSNEASIRLLKRVGFLWEGRRRASIWKSRQWEDMEIYGITAEDWYGLPDERV
ncbi:GNAT family protein [Thermus sp. FJN-A]